MPPVSVAALPGNPAEHGCVTPGTPGAFGGIVGVSLIKREIVDTSRAVVGIDCSSVLRVPVRAIPTYPLGTLVVRVRAQMLVSRVSLWLLVSWQQRRAERASGAVGSLALRALAPQTLGLLELVAL